MLTIPRALCRSAGRISSSIGAEGPYIDIEDLDLASLAGEPVWIMKEGRMRWMGEELYAPEAQRARKLKAVLGTEEQKISSLRSPCVVCSC